VTHTGELLASVILCSLLIACTNESQPSPGASAATCTKTRYTLTLHPRTIVSNERHRLTVRAVANACGRRRPAARARVRLGRHRAITDAHGRATLTVTLTTGRYSVRLYVRGRLVARARLSAIPNVSR